MSALRPLARALRPSAVRTPFTPLAPRAPLAPRLNTPLAPRFNSTSAAPETLNWDAFLKLRKQRRRYNIVASIFTAILGTTIGTSYLANIEIDMTQLIMGMDPLVLFGLATMACGAVGWLGGPVLGERVFAMVHRRVVPQMMVREKEFLKRIQTRRADPSNQSMSNPVPDYYGEKIGSVKDYRQWLKDQRAFKLKREKFI